MSGGVPGGAAAPFGGMGGGPQGGIGATGTGTTASAGAGGGMSWYEMALQGSGLLGNYLQNRAAGQAQGALTEAQMEAARNQAFNQNQVQQAQMDLLRRQYEDQARSQNASNTAKGDVLANVQDVQINASPRVQGHIPTITGGLRPSNFGPNTRSAGQALSTQSLDALKNPRAFDPVQFKENAMPDIGTGQSNVGALLSLASMFSQLYSQNRPRNNTNLYADTYLPGDTR